MNTATLNPVNQKYSETLTEILESKLSNPATASDFDLYGGVNDVLKDVGMTTADSGGKLTFYGQDPLVPRPVRQRQSGEIDPAKGRTSTSIFARHFAASAVSTKGFGKR